jgi:myo-inositol-hexaphosphate 3-phosphohydrolase
MMTLVFILLVAAIGCSQREAPAVEPAPLAFAQAAGHPASGPLPALDVATWRQPGGLDEDRHYAAVGSEGIMVHLADGAFLQRLAQSAASHLAVLYAMPVDEVVADFLVAVDPTSSQLTWFEINAGSGALRRLAGQPAEVGDTVGGLCTHYDPGARRHQVVVVTRAGELQDWTAVAHAGKQPNFANRIIASRERSLPLGGTGGDCAVDGNGNIFVVVDGREVRRVNADSTMAAGASIRSGESTALEGTISAIEAVTDGAGQPVLLIVDQDGRRLVATDASGRLTGSAPLGHTVGALETGGESVAIVAEGGELRLGAWSAWAAVLGIRGGQP